jgi:PiT family inorganic phosphate transporter
MPTSTPPGAKVTTFLPYILLFVALLIALGFEFVNGFHDTANAVATVIYTHSLPAEFAVMWSGFFNFLGVLLSSGAVAFGIVSLLPVELILQVGSSAGFAMVFALLIAAIIWNLGTWYFGLPASSSHTLIGSIIGVGIANALMRGRDGTSGVDWSKADRDRLCAAALAAVRLHHGGGPAAGAEVHRAQSRRCTPRLKATSRRRCGSAAS